MEQAVPQSRSLGGNEIPSLIFSCSLAATAGLLRRSHSNAFAAARAMDANSYSTFSDGKHRVSFDKVVEVMKQTGHDLPSLYKETATGGLAKYMQEQDGSFKTF